MVRSDPPQAPLEVVQFIAEDGRCSYLLASRRTRVAALVDPDPDQEAGYLAKLEASGLRLRAILETSARDDEPAPLWRDIPTVRPLVGRRALMAGPSEVRLAPTANDGSGYTIWGSAYPPVAEREYGTVRIAFGPFHIHVVQLPHADGQIAYRIDDRLFSGVRIRATRSAIATPEALMTLPDHVIVYPRRADRRRSITILAAERLAASVPPDADRLPPGALEPAVLPDEAIEPVDYWTALEEGRRLAAEKRYKAAISAFETALGARPADPIARQNLRRIRELDQTA